MDIVIILIAILLAAVGLFGSVFPGPGPIAVFAGMLAMQWQFKCYNTTTLWVFGILNLLVLVFDYLLPVWIGKRFGASKYGAWGSIIGMIIGTFFTPIGTIAGIIIGAIIGEYMAGRNHPEAFKAGFGTFVGSILTIIIKLGLAAISAFYIVYQAIVILAR